MKIGIFGGTFDPPHTGHLIIAELAREQLKLDKVVFVPAFTPPHKLHREHASPAQRYRMVKLAIRGNKFFEASRMELNRKGISYTVDTLKSFRQKYPRSELFLIVGSDNLVDFDLWRSPSEILTMATVAVYEREAILPKRNSSLNEIKLSGPRIDISSSSIRKRIMEGRTIRYLIPMAVEAFIAKQKLYKIRIGS